MFAHATLSKPLKVNAATTSTVRQRTSKATPNSVPGAAAKTRKDKATQVTPTTVPGTPKFAEKMPSTATPVVTAAPKAPSTTSIQEAAASAPKSPDGKFRYSHTKPKRNSSTDSAKLVIGGCTTVAGIPKSWPKPHAVPPDAKPKIAAKPPPQPKPKPKTKLTPA
jgi:hypothetical protein